MDPRPAAFVVPAQGGTVMRGPAGGSATIKTRTETTAGTFACLDVEIGPGQGPPEHTHAREDEMWYVLDGTFRFIADGEVFEAAQGAFVFVPRGTSHCFQNLSDTTAHMLVMFTPSGMERFFELHAALPEGPVERGVYDEIAERCWMTVTGPPLGVSHPI